MKAAASVEEPAVIVRRQSDRRPRTRRQPPYAVILWNDDDHTYQYVVGMMVDLFGMNQQSSFRIARTVDTQGRAVCLTTTREHAELKRDQIQAYGRDFLIERCVGSMTATIEPVAASS